MADGKRRYKFDRKDYKVSVKLSEKDMDILKAALKRTGMTASAYIRELIRTGGNIDTSYPEDRARAIRIIAGVANNINQAVKLGNSQGRNPASHLKRMLWNISRIRIRQKNVYWWAVLTTYRIRHLSRWKRRKIYFIRQVKGRAIM